MDFIALAPQCAPQVHVDTIHRIIQVESSGNPYAIGVVNGRLPRQPRNLEQAMAAVHQLREQGYDFSVGLMQINQRNFDRFGLTAETAFDVCTNIRTGGRILTECYQRAAGQTGGASPQTLLDAFSCYFSGDFFTGYRLGYVQRISQVMPLAGIGHQQKLQVGALNGPAERPSRLTAKERYGGAVFLTDSMNDGAMSDRAMLF